MKLYRIMFDSVGHKYTDLAKSMTNANRFRVFSEESAKREIAKFVDCGMSMFGVCINVRGGEDIMLTRNDVWVEKKELEMVE